MASCRGGSPIGPSLPGPSAGLDDLAGDLAGTSPPTPPFSTLLAGVLGDFCVDEDDGGGSRGGGGGGEGVCSCSDGLEEELAPRITSSFRRDMAAVNL